MSDGARWDSDFFPRFTKIFYTKSAKNRTNFKVVVNLGKKSDSHQSCHRAIKVIKYLYRKLGRENLLSKRPKQLLNESDVEWSPYSPDLNSEFQHLLI